MLLALTKNLNTNKINYAQIDKNLNDIQYGNITSEELEQFELFNVDLLITDDSPELTDEVENLGRNHEIDVIEIPRAKGLTIANWLNLDNDKLKEIEFPHLAFVDDNDETFITIVNSPTDIKKIHSIKDKSLTQLLNSLEKILDNNKLESLAHDGDESTIDFETFLEIEEKEPFENLSKLFQLAEKKSKDLEDNNNVNDEKIEEAMRLYKLQDFAASFQEALAQYLVYRIYEVAGELGLNLITISGEISKNPRVREYAVRLADEVSYDVRFPENDHYENDAIALAAAEFINRNKNVFAKVK